MKNILSGLWIYLSFSLILVGILGLSWGAFGENGWIERFMGVAWNIETRYPILGIPVIGGTALLVVLFLKGGLQPGKVSWLANLLMYAVMSYGAYFTFQWWNAGALPT